MTKPVEVNKQEVTNYLNAKLTVKLNQTDTNNLVMKNCCVKLVKISPSTITSPVRKILCCTTCSFFLPGGGSVWAMDCGHLLCGGCLQGMRCCRVCGREGLRGVRLGYPCSEGGLWFIKMFDTMDKFNK